MANDKLRAEAEAAAKANCYSGEPLDHDIAYARAVYAQGWLAHAAKAEELADALKGLVGYVPHEHHPGWVCDRCVADEALAHYRGGAK